MTQGLHQLAQLRRWFHCWKHQVLPQKDAEAQMEYCSGAAGSRNAVSGRATLARGIDVFFVAVQAQRIYIAHQLSCNEHMGSSDRI